MELEGKITISRPQLSRGEEYISITLNDVAAGIEFLEVRVSLTEFAQALTGLGYRPCTLLPSNIGTVGMVMERKTQEVFFPFPTYGSKPEQIREVLSPLETDGWRANDYHANNSRNRTSKDNGFTVQVPFTRHVTPAPTH